MSFNPLNIQLQRVAIGINRQKYIQLNRQKIFFGRCLKLGLKLTFYVIGSFFCFPGRATSNDVCFSSIKCSKKHCEIFFNDGRVFIKDLNVSEKLKSH